MTSTSSDRPHRGPLIPVLALVATALVSGCAVDTTALDGGAADVLGSDPDRTADHPLLRRDDLGRGYRENADPGEGEDLTEAGCLSALDALSIPATQRLTVTF